MRAGVYCGFLHRAWISKQQGKCTATHCSVLVTEKLGDKFKTMHRSQGFQACIYVWDRNPAGSELRRQSCTVFSEKL